MNGAPNGRRSCEDGGEDTRPPSRQLSTYQQQCATSKGHSGIELRYGNTGDTVAEGMLKWIVYTGQKADVVVVVRGDWRRCCRKGTACPNDRLPFSRQAILTMADTDMFAHIIHHQCLPRRIYTHSVRPGQFQSCNPSGPKRANVYIRIVLTITRPA